MTDIESLVAELVALADPAFDIQPRARAALAQSRATIRTLQTELDAAHHDIDRLRACANHEADLVATLQTEKVELLAIVDDELSRKPPAHDLTEYGEGGVAALLAVKRRMEALSNTGEME